MDFEIARRLLREAEGDEEPVTLPASILASLSLADLPPDVPVQVGVIKEGVHHIEWSGELRRDGNRIIAEAEYAWTRKYWYEPLGWSSTLISFGARQRRASERAAMSKLGTMMMMVLTSTFVLPSIRPRPTWERHTLKSSAPAMKSKKLPTRLWIK